MKRSMLVVLKKDKSMAKALICGPMEEIMMVTILTIYHMAKECLYGTIIYSFLYQILQKTYAHYLYLKGLMDLFIMEIGLMDYNMDKVWK